MPPPKKITKAKNSTQNKNSPTPNKIYSAYSRLLYSQFVPIACTLLISQVKYSCFMDKSQTQVLRLIQRAREILLLSGRLWVFQTQSSVFETAFAFLQTYILCDRRGSKSSVHQRKQKSVTSTSLACSPKGASFILILTSYLILIFTLPVLSQSSHNFLIPNCILLHFHYF